MVVNDNKTTEVYKLVPSVSQFPSSEGAVEMVSRCCCHLKRYQFIWAKLCLKNWSQSSFWIQLTIRHSVGEAANICNNKLLW